MTPTANWARRRALGTISASALAIAATLGFAADPAGAQSARDPRAVTPHTFIGGFDKVTKIASTVPNLGPGAKGNGDVNPYGTVVVPRSVGKLVKGDVLVSNFNDAANQQGTGVTIMQISPSGGTTVFANLGTQVSGRVGLTTALSVFKNGDVVVGSLPTRDGTAATATAGALYVLGSKGHLVKTISGGKIDGPWDMTSYDGGSFGVLFVSNVLNGTVAAGGGVVHKGDVVRIVLDLTKSVPRVEQESVVASGFGERTDAAALVIGPTGLALAPNGDLYVADTLANRIAKISDALFRTTSGKTGKTVTTGSFLNGPLGLALAPNGDILSVNAGDGQIVETTPAGTQVSWIFIDRSGSPPGAGALFGLAVTPGNDGVYFVDDATNQLKVLHA